jgi:hypothetical protein
MTGYFSRLSQRTRSPRRFITELTRRAKELPGQASVPGLHVFETTQAQQPSSPAVHAGQKPAELSGAKAQFDSIESSPTETPVQGVAQTATRQATKTASPPEPGRRDAARNLTRTEVLTNEGHRHPTSPGDNVNFSPEAPAHGLAKTRQVTGERYTVPAYHRQQSGGTPSVEETTNQVVAATTVSAGPMPVTPVQSLVQEVAEKLEVRIGDVSMHVHHETPVSRAPRKAAHARPPPASRLSRYYLRAW